MFLKILSFALTMVTAITSFAFPKVSFEPAGAYDTVICKTAPSAQQVKDLETVLPEWQKIWSEIGPNYLSQTEQIFAQKFQENEIIASFSLCPDFTAIGTSHPLIFNARYFLKNRPQSSDSTIFVSVIHHELLHRYLDQHFKQLLDPSNEHSSRLIQKYKDEDEFVLAHIHLLALQQEIYFQMGRNEDWKKIEDWIQGTPGTSYQRALAIVKEEGRAAFMSELQQIHLQETK